MNEIIFKVSTSYAARDNVVSFIKNCGFNANKAIIQYNVDRGLSNSECVENYPLTLEGSLNGYSIRLRVCSVTAGYGGAGPHAMVDILRAAGFEFNEYDILSKYRVDSEGDVNLVYKR